MPLEVTMCIVNLLVTRQIGHDSTGKITYGDLVFFLSTEMYEKMSRKFYWNETEKKEHIWCERPTEWTTCLIEKSDYARFLTGEPLTANLVHFSGVDVDHIYMLGRAGEHEVYTA